MKSRIFHACLLLFLFPCSVLWAENRDSISKYFQLRNQAELAIVDSNYQQALDIYNTAFTFHRPHEKDIFNAFILSCLLQDTMNARKHFDTLVYLGIPAWSLQDDVRQDRMDTNFIKLINQDYPELRAKSLASEMKTNARYMDSLDKIDQGIRQIAAKTKDGYTVYRDSIRKCDSANLSSMNKFIKDRGFPDIYKTGFYADNYRHISSYPMIYLLLRHTIPVSSSRPDKAELMKSVYQAVMDGQYDPRDYAFFYDESEGVNKYGSVFKSKIIDGKQVWDEMDKDEIRTINEARKSIYLESLEDYKKKLEFMRHSYFFCMINVFTIMYNHIQYEPNSVK